MLCAFANPTLNCNDIYGNAGGDAICGTDGGNNFSLDPQLCSQGCADVGLSPGSPCAPANNACGVQIGARGVTCAPVPVLFANVTATLLPRGVRLEWSIETDDAVAEFSVARAVGSSSSVVVAKLTPEARNFVDSNVQPNTTYRYLVVATNSTGDVFQSQTIDVRVPRTALELTQNQPNPFNPSTRITFALPEAGFADVSVFDVSGKRVATLLSGLRRAGRATVEWNGLDDRGNAVGSGIYFCRLTAGGQTRTIKMVLMK
jgi:hypothetical protein